MHRLVERSTPAPSVAAMISTARLKSTWVTRRIPVDLDIDWRPIAETTRVGDLLLCEVISPSLHGRAETVDGARSKLYPGDHLICAVGNRYATSLLEGIAEVTTDEIDLLSASGLCGRSLSLVDKSARPTRLRVLAQAFSSGRPINLRDFSRPRSAPGNDPRWVVVVGSAMDSGKTTACASLIHGFADAGMRVGAAKITGTASSRDVGSFRDAGASPVFDFLDSGWPSTAGCSSTELLGVVHDLRSHLSAAGVDVAVLEIADGLLQAETRTLLGDIRSVLDDLVVVLTAVESLAGVAGVRMLQELGHPVAAVSGIVTNSPLAMREIAEATGVACLRTTDLARHARRLLEIETSRIELARLPTAI